MRLVATIRRLLALVLLAGALDARDIIVLLDLSGSMKHYAGEGPDVRAAVNAVLTEASIPSKWQLTGATKIISEFALNDQDHVRIVEFGSVARDADYPFFPGISQPLTRDEFLAKFPTDPSHFTQAKTNSALAEAVAARMLSTSSDPGSVIEVSDFMMDQDLSPKQLQFVNQVQPLYGRQTIATLSWESDPRLQIKLLKLLQVASLTDSPSNTSDSVGHLRLGPAVLDKPRRTMSLSWVYEGSTLPQQYDLTVRNSGNTPVAEKKGLLGTKILLPVTASGQFHWSVTALMANGTSVQQTSSFIVSDDGPGFFGVAFLALIILSMVGLVVFLIRAHGLPDVLSFMKKKKPYSEI